jgi:hypothetical protein
MKSSLISAAFRLRIWLRVPRACILEIFTRADATGPRINGTVLQRPLLYLLADWLGGLRLWKDQSGNTDLTCENFPFGDGKTCQGGFSTTWGVFGDENDSEDNTYCGHWLSWNWSPSAGMRPYALCNRRV